MAKLNKTIGFLGCGNMGSAILKGLLSKKVTSSGKIYVYDIQKKQLTFLKRKYKVKVVKSVEELFEKSDIAILAVKPQSLKGVSFSKAKKIKTKLVISILAGTKSQSIKKKFKFVKVVRVMPNLGAMVGEGVSAISGTGKNQASKLAGKIFKSCGDVVYLSESKFDAVTAISGSGPAYYFYLTELMVQNAVSLGIPKDKALKLAVQTALGSGLLLKDGTFSPSVFRQKVTSKGGTTEAALKTWKKKHFDKIFKAGIQAAVKRGKVLSRNS